MTEVVTLVNNIVGTLFQVLQNVSRNEDIEKYLKICKQNMKLFKNYLALCTNIGEKNNLISVIGYMKGIQEKLKRKLNSNINVNKKMNQSDRIKWLDVDATFNKRIRYYKFLTYRSN